MKLFMIGFAVASFYVPIFGLIIQDYTDFTEMLQLDNFIASNIY